MIGKWKQLKGKARRAWGRAMGDGATQAHGAAEELGGVIQEKAAGVKAAAAKAADPNAAVPADEPQPD